MEDPTALRTPLPKAPSNQIRVLAKFPCRGTIHMDSRGTSLPLLQLLVATLNNYSMGLGIVLSLVYDVTSHCYV